MWESAEEVDQQALVRWYFKCSVCKVVISTIPDAPISALAEPVNVAKAPLEVNLRIEGVERKQDEDFVGEELPLAELQLWAEEEES